MFYLKKKIMTLCEISMKRFKYTFFEMHCVNIKIYKIKPNHMVIHILGLWIILLF